MRPDLYYRLCIGQLLLPPLSARPGDITLLANYFIEKYGPTMVNRIIGLSDEVGEKLKHLPWPGNVRMLENVIVRSMLQQERDGPLGVLAYDEEIFSPVSYSDTAARPKAWEDTELPVSGLDETLDAFERQLIINALNATNGNVAKAAKQLSIPRTTLYYKVKKYHLTLCVSAEAHN